MNTLTSSTRSDRPSTFSFCFPFAPLEGLCASAPRFRFWLKKTVDMQTCGSLFCTWRLKHVPIFSTMPPTRFLRKRNVAFRAVSNFSTFSTTGGPQKAHRAVPNEALYMADPAIHASLWSCCSPAFCFAKLASAWWDLCVRLLRHTKWLVWTPCFGGVDKPEALQWPNVNVRNEWFQTRFWISCVTCLVRFCMIRHLPGQRKRKRTQKQVDSKPNPTVGQSLFHHRATVCRTFFFFMD